MVSGGRRDERGDSGVEGGHMIDEPDSQMPPVIATYSMRRPRCDAVTSSGRCVNDGRFRIVVQVDDPGRPELASEAERWYCWGCAKRLLWLGRSVTIPTRADELADGIGKGIT